MPPITKDDLKYKLKNIDFLNYLSEPDFNYLVKECTCRKLEPDEVLFESGEVGSSMYILLEGQIVIFINETLIETQLPGSYFGEMAIIESKPRSASAKAIEPSILVEFNKDIFYSIFATNPKILLVFLKVFSERSRNAVETLGTNFAAQRKINTRLYRILQDSTNEVFIFDSTTFDLIKVNPRARDNLEYGLTEIRNLNAIEIFRDKTKEDLEVLVAPLRSGEKTLAVFNDFLIRKNGTVYPTSVQIQFLHTENMPVFVALAQDKTKEQALENKIKSMAFYDSLTGLPNRNQVNDRMGLLMAQAKRYKKLLGVLLLDLDNFKIVNDSLGHAAGDALLKKVSKRLKGCVREEDTIARLGGDEFIFLCPGIQNEAEVLSLAKKIVGRLDSPYKVLGHEIFSSASVGVSIYPVDGESPETLIRNADVAMYKAKETGKGSFQRYESLMFIKASKRLSMERELRKALDKGQLFLHFQPKIELDTEKVTGAEALVRWQHPEQGLVSPGVFIPIAEDCGLINQLGEWVLWEACKQIKEFERLGWADFNISVNLSGHQFEQGNLANIIEEIISTCKINTCHLELEVTETILMNKFDLAVGTLSKLQEMGINISIDDFGTGYSSLAYLKELPIDCLKIDQSFVKDICKIGNKANATITQSIISLAKALNLKTIAEGVELLEEMDFLRLVGCDQMQGYYFSKPLPSDELKKLIF